MSVTVYSRQNCVYCSKVIHFLESHSIDFEEKMVDVDFNRGWLRSNYPQAVTFPVVVVNGQFIGGLTETMTYYNRAINEQQLLNEGY